MIATIALHVGQAASWLAQGLLAGSIQGAVVVGLVWLVCRRVPSVPAGLRAALWWLASLKLVLALTPLPALTLPLLPAEAPVAIKLSPVRAPVAPSMDDAIIAPSTARVPQVEAGTGAGALGTSPWVALAIGLWLFGVMAQARRLLAAHHRLRGVVSRSVSLAGDEAALATRIARDIGLSSLPDVRVSDEIDAPQVVGTRRPIVLIPAAVVATFSDEERAMTLCHELTHVRRRDLHLGWVPALAERLFFFHPLARLAAREYLVAREAACDAAVVRALDVSPHDYGRLLVRLGVTASEPGLSAAGSATSSSSLGRRLDMLHHITRPGVSRVALWLVVAAAGLALVPLKLVARAEPVVPSATVGVAEGDVAAPDEPQATVAKASPGALAQDAALGDVLDAFEYFKLEMARQKDGTWRGEGEVQARAQDASNLNEAAAEVREAERAVQQAMRQAEEAQRRSFEQDIAKQVEQEALKQFEREQEIAKRLEQEFAKQLGDERLQERAAGEEFEKLVSQLSQIQGDLQQAFLRAQLEAGRQSVQDSRGELAEVLEALARARAQTAQDRDRALEMRLKEMQFTLDSLRQPQAKPGATGSEIDSLRANLAALNKQLEVLSQERQALLSEQKRLSAEVARLAEQLRNLAAASKATPAK